MSIPKFQNLDSEESIFFARELEKVKSKSYDVKYPEYKARSLLPVSNEAGPGAQSISYEQYDEVGMAKMIRDYADDLPRSDVKGKLFTAQVKSIGMAYGYNIQEVRSAKMAGKPLEQRRANAAKKAHLQLENSLAFLGDTASGFVGFLKHPNASVVTLAADGTGGSTTLASKTADLILRDMNLVANKPFSISKGVFQADTFVVPLDVYTLISTTPRSSNSDTTILEFFLKNSPFIKEVVWLNELKGIGAGSTDRMLAYKKDPEYVQMEVPQDFEQLPVQEKGLEMVVNCHARFGGVTVPYPLAIAYADGV